VDNRAWLMLIERTSHLQSHERQALAIMWGALIVFGPPGLVLTLLRSPGQLPIALVVIIGGTAMAVTFTALKVFPKRARMLASRQNEAETEGIEL
jgi:hypothetical protein